MKNKKKNNVINLKTKTLPKVKKPLGELVFENTSEDKSKFEGKHKFFKGLLTITQKFEEVVQTYCEKNNMDVSSKTCFKLNS